MSEDLLKAIERVQLYSNNSKIEKDENDLFSEQNSDFQKRVRPHREQIKAQLEKEYLNPSITFNTEWLNKLQQ